MDVIEIVHSSSEGLFVLGSCDVLLCCVRILSSQQHMSAHVAPVYTHSQPSLNPPLLRLFGAMRINEPMTIIITE